MRERRTAPRYDLELPIVVRRVPTLGADDVSSGETGNISTSGIYFTADRRLAVDDVGQFLTDLCRVGSGGRHPR